MATLFIHGRDATGGRPARGRTVPLGAATECRANSPAGSPRLAMIDRMELEFALRGENDNIVQRGTLTLDREDLIEIMRHCFAALDRSSPLHDVVLLTPQGRELTGLVVPTDRVFHIRSGNRYAHISAQAGPLARHPNVTWVRHGRDASHFPSREDAQRWTDRCIPPDDTMMIVEGYAWQRAAA